MFSHEPVAARSAPPTLNEFLPIISSISFTDNAEAGPGCPWTIFWRASGLAGQSIGGYHQDIALSFDPLFTRPARPLALQVETPDLLYPGQLEAPGHFLFWRASGLAGRLCSKKRRPMLLGRQSSNQTLLLLISGASWRNQVHPIQPASKRRCWARGRRRLSRSSSG